MRLALVVSVFTLLIAAACGGSGDDSNGSQNTGGSDGGASTDDGSTDGGISSGDGSITNRDGGASSIIHVVMGTGGKPGHLVDPSGAVLQLHGVDRSGTEDSCDYSSAAFDTPVDQAAVDVMKTWNVNAVRVPLNASCWLGTNSVMFGGKQYQDAIKTYVALLTTNKLTVILDLHWTVPGDGMYQTGQLQMADADHSPEFWKEVATVYANQPNIIFDLFNEPFLSDWDCWLVGGMCAKSFDGTTALNVAGMATLIKAVRSTGAQNVVILGGLGYSSDFSQWLAKVSSIPTLPAPNDGIALTNIAASWHTYSDQSVETKCPSEYDGYSGTCVDGTTNATNYGITALLAAGFPVVIGEIGTQVYASGASPYSGTQATMLDSWLESALTYMDGQQQGYLGWDWNTSAPPLLLANFDGTPSPHFGVTYKAHLAKLPK
ncbi:MAG: cellulase family glycosylhydrolase [Polyangiaceae bacterium]